MEMHNSSACLCINCPAADNHTYKKWAIEQVNDTLSFFVVLIA